MRFQFEGVQLEASTLMFLKVTTTNSAKTNHTRCKDGFDQLRNKDELSWEGELQEYPVGNRQTLDIHKPNEW